ncbi:MAG: ArsR/SmtB family transcription factor [Rhizobiaceae bacterium]
MNIDLQQWCHAPGSAKQLADKLAALSHPARIGILLQLGGAGPCCCKQVVEHFDLAQSTVSQHLKVLVEAGLVRHSSKAQRSFYEIDPEAMAGVSSAFAALAANCCPPKTESE